MSVTYTAVLPVAEETVLFVSRLLADERRRRGTRGHRRALGCYRPAVLVLRWFLDGTRLAQLATDHRIGRSTAYRYLHEGHRRPRRGRAGVARGAAGRPSCWPSARHRGRNADPDRPVCGRRPDDARRPIRSAGGPVVVGQARR